MRKYLFAVIVGIAFMIGFLVPVAKVETQTPFLMMANYSGTPKTINADSTGNLLVGTATTSIGKVEDGAHVSGDGGVQALGVRKETNTQNTSADGDFGSLTVDGYGGLFTRQDHNNRINCRLTTTATTSTAITGCTAPGAGLSIYITDVNVMGGVANGATAAASIQYGTGGSCGTGTTVVYDCQHPATSGCTANFSIPIKAAANSELCILDAAVGTKFINVIGFIAP